MEHTSPDGGTDLHSFDDAAQSAGMLYGLFESHSLSGYSMQFYTGSRIYFTAFCRVRAFDLPLTPLLGGDFKILDFYSVFATPLLTFLLDSIYQRDQCFGG
jgi:hypothetical protein